MMRRIALQTPGVAPISSMCSAPSALGLYLLFLLGPQKFLMEPFLSDLATSWVDSWSVKTGEGRLPDL